MGFDGPKFNKKNMSDDRLARIEEVSKLYRQGLSYREIAEKTGISRSVVGTIMKDARKIWKQRATKSYAAHLYEQLAKIDELECEAWKGWSKSNRDHVETLTEDSEGPTGKTSTCKIKRYAQSGDAKFLQIINDCIQRRCNLLGLLDPEVRNGSSIDGEVQVVSIVIESREEAAALQELDFKQFSRLVQNDPVPAELGQ